MIVKDRENTERYSPAVIEALQTQIELEGGIREGSICPNCQEGTFERHISHIEYNKTDRKVTAIPYTFMKCNLCNLKIKDDWEFRETWAWELTR